MAYIVPTIFALLCQSNNFLLLRYKLKQNHTKIERSFICFQFEALKKSIHDEKLFNRSIIVSTGLKLVLKKWDDQKPLALSCKNSLYKKFSVVLPIGMLQLDLASVKPVLQELWSVSKSEEMLSSIKTQEDLA